MFEVIIINNNYGIILINILFFINVCTRDVSKRVKCKKNINQIVFSLFVIFWPRCEETKLRTSIYLLDILWDTY